MMRCIIFAAGGGIAFSSLHAQRSSLRHEPPPSSLKFRQLAVLKAKRELRQIVAVMTATVANFMK